jgi:hypothetical protein
VCSIRHTSLEFRKDKLRSKCLLIAMFQIVSMSANLHRLLNLLLQIGRRPTDAGGPGGYQVLGRKIERGAHIWSGFAYGRRIGLRSMSHRAGGRWSVEQHANLVGAERRRHRSARLDPRPIPRLVHNNVVELSEFPSIGELAAYLWNGVKAGRRLPRSVRG